MTIINAASLEQDLYHNIILVGQAGGGKSKLAATLPGRSLVFMFDPSALAAYRGYKHVDTIKYDINGVNLQAYSLSKDANKKVLRSVSAVKVPQAYNQFDKDFNDLLKSGDVDNYDNLIIDSTTTVQDHIMDVVLYMNGRLGHAPQQDDYPAQMNTTQKVFRWMTSLPINTVFIMHDTLNKDEISGKIEYTPLITGKLKGKLPNLFNHYLRCFAKPSGKGVRYMIQTVPDHQVQGCRTSFTGLDPKHDVTIEDLSRPQDYGLGKILRDQSK